MALTKVQRNKDNGDATLGFLTLEQSDFTCYTLEDEYRDVKVNGETRIPAGYYALEPVYTSGLAKKYKKRFGHPFVVGINAVPGFDYIRIHCGNTDDHTEGCILVGTSQNEENFTIGASTKAYVKWFEAVKDDVKSGTATILILDEK